MACSSSRKLKCCMSLNSGTVAPLALSRGKPSLPGGRLAIGRRPIAVDQERDLRGRQVCFRRPVESKRGLQTGQKVSLKRSSTIPSVGACAARWHNEWRHRRLRPADRASLSVPITSSGTSGCNFRHAGRRGTSHRLANAFVVVTRRGCWSLSRLTAAIAAANASSPPRTAGNNPRSGIGQRQAAAAGGEIERDRNTAQATGSGG